MLRTWPVRLVAIAFTLSVRSFQVPATPFTFAWPPSLPSVPTSRATRVTSDAKPFELVDHRVHDLADAQEFAAQRTAVDFDRHALGKVALGDRADHAGDFRGRLDHVLDQLVDGAELAVSQPPLAPFLTRPRWVILPSLPTTLERRSNSWVISSFMRDHFVEEAGDLAVDAVGLFGQANAEIAAAQRTECADELAAIDKVPLGLDVHAYVSVWLFSPRPGCTMRSPPAANSPVYQRIRFTLPENFDFVPSSFAPP